MSGCSPIPPDGCGAEARAKGVSGDPRRFSKSERDVDCPSRRSLPGEEVHHSKETSLILPPLTTEKVGRDSTPQPSGGPAVTRCPERWRDKAPLPAHLQPPVAPAQLGKQRLGSTASVCSRQSCKSTASHIQEVAGDDRCAHCALACLFCEFLALCSLALDGLDCGALCLAGGCCAGGDPPGQGCGGGGCPCGVGCGLLQDCCDPADCLDICLECCSICFPV
ncbi:myoD family inhibitor domain-containing protein isoform X2 [Chelonia mydas]|uniref:myoD family inhibitor domain-containing protein isoform X2 n=1 Tax=Chelonia mydas TaxID=8469 RepID=UPI0018A20598|nr:myoD family inhibitor domain-containing protein isoform X2 [Chelonia mydas]